MAIQMRRGLKADFDPSRMLAGEWAVSTDANTDDQKVWMCFGNGSVKQIATVEDLESKFEEIEDDFDDVNDSLDELNDSIKQNTVAINNRIKKFYTSNLGEDSVSDSDDGAIRDMKIYGNSQQKQLSGKNLLNDKDISTSTWASSGTSSVLRKVFQLKPNTSYTLTSYKDRLEGVNAGAFIVSGNDLNFVAKTDENGAKVGSPRTVVSDSDGYITCGVYNDMTTEKYQLEEGDSATLYEPYCGGIPRPNPQYPQDIHSVVNPMVEVKGKNKFIKKSLFDMSESDGVYTCTKTKENYIRFQLWSVDKNNSRVERGSATLQNGIVSIAFTQNNYVDLQIGLYSSIFYDAYVVADISNLQNGNYIVSFNCVQMPILNSQYGIFKDVMIESGSTATAYQPYKVQYASTKNITLRSIGNIKDYVDVERKCVVRNIGKSKAIDFGIQSWNEDRLLLYNMVSADLSVRPLFSEDYKYVNWSDYPSQDYCISTNGSYVCVRDISFESRADAESKIADVDIYYAKSTPTTEPLTDEQLADFLALHSYYPTTNITVTSDDINGSADFLYPCSLENFVEYIKEQQGDTRDFIYNMSDIADQAFINAQYAEILAELNL